MMLKYFSKTDLMLLILILDVFFDDLKITDFKSFGNLFYRSLEKNMN